MAGESAREVARKAREKAARLERRAEMFERGAEGESKTAEVLSALPPEWTSIHDLRWPGRRLANVDHIVLGPGGIFVIDSKHWSGAVSMANGILRQNGRSREAVVASAADAALAVAGLVGPHAVNTHAVLCFVGEDDRALAGWCRDVMICTGENLRDMLISRPRVLSAADASDAWIRLDAQLHSALAPRPNPMPYRSHGATAAVPTRAAAKTRPQTSGRSRSAGKGPSLSRFLVGILMLLVLLNVGPQLMAGVGVLVTEFMTRHGVPTACPEPLASKTSATER